MADDKINLFGRSQQLIGDGKSDVVLNTRGKIRIKIGTKFIDLFDGNKIKGSDTEFIFTGSEVGNKEGIWILDDDEIWIKQKNSDPINIKSDISKTYVSYIEEQSEVTSEQKLLALKNIGFFVNSYSDLNTEIDGIFYVLEDQQLYIIKNGNINPFTINSSNVISEEETEEEFSLPYITYDGNTVTINDNLQINKFDVTSPINFICNNIKSENGNSAKGFQLIYQNGIATLYVDNIVVRNGLDKELLEIYPEFWFSEVNVITSIERDEDDEDDESEESFYKYKIYLKTDNTYKEEDMIGFYVSPDELIGSDEIDDESDEETYLEESNKYILVKFEIESVEDSFIVTKNSDISLEESISNKTIFLLNRENLISLSVGNGSFNISDGEKVYSRFGNLTDLNKQLPDDSLIEGSGIYSEQLYADNAAYVKDYKLPDEDNSSKFASTEWVKRITGVTNVLPIGSIIMYHGTSIPEGWNICDGTNGTPNLIGKFIKSDVIESENEIELNNDTDIVKTSLETYSLVFIMKII